MDFDELAYSEVILANGVTYNAERDVSAGEISIPCTEAPDIGIGDVITLKSGKHDITFKVLDTQFIKGGTLNIGTNHPHLFTLHVQNSTAKEHQADQVANTTFNIGSITSEQLQVGNQNVQTVTINVQKLVEEVANSGDPEAKSILKTLLQNSTVGSVIGAGVSGLISML
ncbi:TPA: hypothetical protein ACGUON_000775 [Vibrio vulnificus]